jgi:hypothetical protein
MQTVLLLFLFSSLLNISKASQKKKKKKGNRLLARAAHTGVCCMLRIPSSMQMQRPKKKRKYIEDKTAENTYSPGSLCNSFEIDHHPAREREKISRRE